MTTNLVLPIVLLITTAQADCTVDILSSSYCVRIVGDVPMPYQAVRLRQSFSNADTQPFLNARCGVFFNAIRRPNTERYEEMNRAVWFSIAPGRESQPQQRSWGPNEIMCLTPGERLTETQASACYFMDEKIVPLFPIPGEYRITWLGRNAPTRHVVVNVSQPQGADRAVFDFLRQDSLLAAAMMHPAEIPDSETVTQLEALVHQHPQSSYSNYALLALARGRLRGCGVEAMAESLFGSLETARTRIKSRLADPRTRRSHLENDVRNRIRRFHGPLRGAELLMLNQLEGALAASDGEKERVARHWAPFFYVSPDDRAAALTYLRRIHSASFALRPQALVMESRLLRIVRVMQLKAEDTRAAWGVSQHWDYFRDIEHPHVKSVSDQLNRDYRDSIEWIWEMYRFIDTAEAWRAFRVQPPPAADRR